MRSPTQSATSQARRLRKTMTKAEVIIWRHLRKRQIYNMKFRRQCPIGPYIADFACVEVKLIVEIDGDSHASAKGIDHDEVRTACLHRLGWSVLRFWNNDIYENLDGVLETIGARARDLDLAGHE